MCAFTATLGLQCRSRHCGVHSNQFCRTAGCSLPLQTCMVPSDIMKLVLREEAFRSSPVQGSLCPVSGVHSVFNSRDLASTSGGIHGRVFKALPWWILGSTVRQNMFTSSSQSNRSPRMQDQQKLETEITIHLHPLRTKFVVVISLSVLGAFWFILWPCSDLSACVFNVKCLQGNPQLTRSEKVHLYLAWASLQRKRSLFVCFIFTWCIAVVIQMSDLEVHTYNAHISTTCYTASAFGPPRLDRLCCVPPGRHSQPLDLLPTALFLQISIVSLWFCL